jgi:hypothetical protein
MLIKKEGSPAKSHYTPFTMVQYLLNCPWRNTKNNRDRAPQFSTALGERDSLRFGVGKVALRAGNVAFLAGVSSAPPLPLIAARGSSLPAAGYEAGSSPTSLAPKSSMQASDTLLTRHPLTSVKNEHIIIGDSHTIVCGPGGVMSPVLRMIDT